MNRTALIVGAGIGGLSAAIALRRSGWNVRILERAPAPRAAGYALSVAPNAVRALQELGVAAAVTAEAHAARRVEIRNARGRRLKGFDIEAALAGTRTLFTEREALHRVLLHAAGSQNVTFSADIAGVEATEADAAVTMKDGERMDGDIVVGADGAFSTVRTMLHGEAAAVRYSGYWAVRGLARRVMPLLAGRSIVVYMGGGMEAAAIRAGEDAIYWYASLRSPGVPPVDRCGERLAEVLARLHDPSFHAIVEATRADQMRADALYEMAPLPAWGRATATLLGDAAQPVLPHTGQGAALALEDAVALGLALSGRDTLAGLRRYERVRAMHKRRLVALGPRMARFTTASSPVASWLREAAIRLMPTGSVTAAFLDAGSRDPHRELRRNS